MVYSLGLILLLGFLAGYLLNKIKIPGLTGMIIVGLIIGPYCLNWLSDEILNISSQLRQIALVIILTRSGLNLDIQSLKKVGRPALLMCFVPATFEIIGTMLSSHFLLGMTWTEALLLGSVLGAVSPAVVSPRMIKLIEEGYGEEHSVPELVLAGSSADDIYVIVLFYAFLGLAENKSFDGWSLCKIPVSIILGILLGLASGFLLGFLFRKIKMNTVINVLFMLSSSFLMIGLENLLKPYVSVSSLLGIMVMGMVVLFTNKEKSKEISSSYNNIWKFFEIILFVLVGASVDISYAWKNSFMALLVLLIALAFRSMGVIVCLIATSLTKKERLFCIISYLPKATVQASIGGIALSLGLPCGTMILSVSVISILISAPLGAFLIDFFGRKLLTKSEPEKEEINPEEEKESISEEAEII